MSKKVIEYDIMNYVIKEGAELKIEVINELLSEFQRANEENERLKKELWQLQHRKMWNKEATLQAELLIKENERLKKESIENLHYLACMTEQRNKLKLALEEIREILCEGRTFYDGYFENENLSRTDKAIKVINEVLG